VVYYVVVSAKSISLITFTLAITARQYGEVVLPDEASGQGPGTLARKLSRCKEGMAHFLPSGYKFYRSRACRGTSLIEAGKLSRYRIFVRDTCAVSRYKFDRSQETVTVQDLYCGQMSVSGCNNHYKFILSAGSKQKV